MDSTPADHRKFRCLVAHLGKQGVTTVEQALALQPPLEGYDFAMVCRALELLSRKSQPRWLKAVGQLLGGKDAWRPENPDEWLTFEELRLRCANCQPIIGGRSALVWSPVETWLVMTYPAGSAYYLRSLLTDEVTYLFTAGGRSYQVPADNSTNLPSNRNPISSNLSSATFDHLCHLPRGGLESVSDLHRAVRNASEI